MGALEDFLDYHRSHSLAWELDTHVDHLVWFSRRLGLDAETRCWLCFLEGCCEWTSVAMLLFARFPSMASATPDAVAEFCERRKFASLFAYEYKWVYYRLPEVVRGYRRLVARGGGSQVAAVRRHAAGPTPEARYAAFTRSFAIPQFGAYAMLDYTELLKYLCGLDVSATIDVGDNYSVRQGLLYALGVDRVYPQSVRHSRPSAEERLVLEAGLADIMRKVAAMDILPRFKTMWAVETSLCTYNKFLHGKRYMGYYRERQVREMGRVMEATREYPFRPDASIHEEYLSKWGEWGNAYDCAADFPK